MTRSAIRCSDVRSAAMLVAALSLVLAMLSPLVSAPSGCADVVVVGVRGSGQPAGFGEQVAPVVEGVEAALESRRLDVRLEALEYPAISVSDSFGLVLLTGDYDRSVQAGVDALQSHFRAEAASCPSTEFVLVGYSQGAQVIKTALTGSVPETPIAAVILLADPTRDATQRSITRLGDPTAERNGSFGPISLSQHVSAVSIDVCASGDGVCERGRQSFTAHTEGYADAVEAVVPVFVGKLDKRSGFGLTIR